MDLAVDSFIREALWLTKVFQKRVRSENVFLLNDQKMYLVHKRTDIRPEIALFFLGISEARFIIATFWYWSGAKHL